MMSQWSTLGSLGLLVLGTRASLDDAHYPQFSTTVANTHYIDTTVPHYVNTTISSIKSSIVDISTTIFTTTTLCSTVSFTTYPTPTLPSPSYDPCPTTCSLSVETVNLYFWPTDRPYVYPATYFDANLDYTFTSPSVYMLIPTAQGTNSLGPTGPSTSNWMLPLDLSEVSTIIDGSITRQLSLSDLGTDCPGIAEPSAIATMSDSRCDPILAAPQQVSSWAYPCNACGRFGLFDPPYAVPTLTGDLVETTTATATPTPVQTTTAPTVTSHIPSSTSATTSTTPVVTASAMIVKGRLAGLIPSIFAIFLLL